MGSSDLELTVLLGILSAAAVVALSGFAIRKLARRRSFAKLEARFASIVSPSVLRQMADDPMTPALHGERREVTVLVAGIRNFDRMAASMPPLELVALVQDWLTPTTEIVLDRGGTLDVCAGSRLVAIFGAPLSAGDHVARGCDAALAIRSRLRELNAEWRRHGLRTIEVGIGLGTGPATVGNMGADDRFRYTAAGPAVALASGIEGRAEEWGVSIAVAEPVAARASARFAFREIDETSLDGGRDAVRVFELAGRAVDGVSARSFLDPYERALTAYRAGDLIRAERLFCQAKWSRPADGPCTLWLQRIAVERAGAQRARG